MENCVLVVHGGAWTLPLNKIEVSREGVKEAAKEGWKQLLEGGSAVSAVQAAIIALEDNPEFDAGYGSVMNDLGEVEMDALIMDGAKMRSGAAGAVSSVKNPIKLARHIMENTDHTFLVGKGAERQAKIAGIEQVDPESMVTQEGKDEFQLYKQYDSAVNSLYCARNKELISEGLGHDTVGCVARDSEGNLACGTSTGGITGKMAGRIGAVGCIGCGGYADNQVGCASTTGHGESLTKACVAYTAIHNLEQGLSPCEAGLAALNRMMNKVGGAGGIILIDRNGDWSAQFSTERMAWAAIKGDRIFSGVHPDEINEKPLSL